MLKEKNIYLSKNAVMEDIFHSIERIAPYSSTVLILGESGTGKELVSKAIHDLSGRTGKFVAVNCGAIPDNLLESELFGYERGAFTGAVQQKKGKFELAQNGTIFLDEIGEMSMHLQVKLLRVLQEKVVEPIGGTKSLDLDVRVIAATNLNLSNLVKLGRFRDDLFYRLQVIPLNIPPLRERKQDIIPLAEHFAFLFSKKHVTKLQNNLPLIFSEQAKQVLIDYSWPGNIRELENLIERLSITLEERQVKAEDIAKIITSNSSHTSQKIVSFGNTQSRESYTKESLPRESLEHSSNFQLSRQNNPKNIDADYTSNSLQSSDTTNNSQAENSINNLQLVLPHDGVDLADFIEEIQKDLIRQALSKSAGNKKEAAKLLRLNRTTLVEKMRRMGI